MYRTFKNKLREYQQSNVQENWSPYSKFRLSHRVFADSTGKQAVELYETTYDNTNKPGDGNDLAALLMMMHKQKNPVSVVIHVSSSILARIKEQDNMDTNRATTSQSTMMSVDDNVIQSVQTLLNDTFINYDDHCLIMNSDCI